MTVGPLLLLALALSGSPSEREVRFMIASICQPRDRKCARDVRAEVAENARVDALRERAEPKCRKARDPVVCQNSAIMADTYRTRK